MCISVPSRNLYIFFTYDNSFYWFTILPLESSYVIIIFLIIYRNYYYVINYVLMLL